MVARDDNLCDPDENEKDENRPLCFGLHGKVRLARLLFRKNRTIGIGCAGNFGSGRLTKNRHGGSRDGWWCVDRSRLGALVWFGSGQDVGAGGQGKIVEFSGGIELAIGTAGL